MHRQMHSLVRERWTAIRTAGRCGTCWWHDERGRRARGQHVRRRYPLAARGSSSRCWPRAAMMAARPALSAAWRSLNRGERLASPNWGNEGNRQRAGWTRLTGRASLLVLQTLTPAEWAVRARRGISSRATGCRSPRSERSARGAGMTEPRPSRSSRPTAAAVQTRGVLPDCVRSDADR